MGERIDTLIEGIRHLEEELELELAKSREELRVQLIGRKVRFPREVSQQHRRMKTGLIAYIADVRPAVLLTSPFIFALIVPLVLLDLLASLYQAICFPIYGIPKVARGEHLVFDRHHLGYLNIIEKVNCAYCSYANGLVGYVREIAARTEQHWCPIKHARRVAGAHSSYSRFLDYGDAASYRERFEDVRCDFAPKPHGKPPAKP